MIFNKTGYLIEVQNLSIKAVQSIRKKAVKNMSFVTLMESTDVMGNKA